VTNICLYHSADLDGKCSGVIVKMAHPESELYGIDYGDDIPWSKLRGSIVYLVDFSFQPWSLMERLFQEAEHVTWIDHHKSAIREWSDQKDHPENVTAVLQEGKAACELCYEYFYRGSATPYAVMLLGRYDVWDLDHCASVLPFQMGMRVENTSVDSYIWNTIFTDVSEVNRITNQGEAILKYQDNCNRRIMTKSFVVKWKGKRFLAVNAGGINSQAFGSAFDPEKHDAVMSYYYDGSQRQWTVSLYSPNNSCDLSGLAKQMGGGGHASACGFQTSEINKVLGI
jgi:uncharacterized protein